jgi:cytochrome c
MRLSARYAGAAAILGTGLIVAGAAFAHDHPAHRATPEGAASTGPAAPAARPGDSARGAAVFETICSACHTIEDGARRRVGPNLFGVVGARIAQRQGYPYTEAFRRADIVWDEATLAAFLAAPSTIVPGTKMDWAVRDPQQIADLIVHLRSFAPKIDPK